MPRRSIFWLTLATAFTFINAGGAVWAFAERELLHCLVHVVGTALGGFWIWAVARRARRQRAGLEGAGDSRLTYLEQSLDAMALQVERIGEAQRFNQKLVEEVLTGPRTGEPR
jgi:hypothetical protein